MQTHLDVQPPPVRTQTRRLVGRSLDLAVVDPQGLQAEGGAVWKEREIRSSEFEMLVYQRNQLLTG